MLKVISDPGLSKTRGRHLTVISSISSTVKSQDAVQILILQMKTQGKGESKNL